MLDGVGTVMSKKNACVLVMDVLEDRGPRTRDCKHIFWSGMVRVKTKHRGEGKRPLASRCEVREGFSEVAACWQDMLEWGSGAGRG